MSTITFDTHKFVKTLAAAGLPEMQAEAISSAVRDAHDGAETASKNDLKQMGLLFTSDLKEMEFRFGTDLKEMEFRFGTDLRQVRVELKEVQTGLRADMKEMKLGFEAKCEKIYGEMTLLKWMVGLLVAGTTTLILKSFF